MKKIGIIFLSLGFILFFVNLYTKEMFNIESIIFALLILIGSVLSFLDGFRKLKETTRMSANDIKSLFSSFLIGIFSVVWMILVIFKMGK